MFVREDRICLYCGEYEEQKWDEYHPLQLMKDITEECNNKLVEIRKPPYNNGDIKIRNLYEFYEI